MPARLAPPTAADIHAALDELRAHAGGLIDFDLASRCLGISMRTAYDLAARHGELITGVPLVRLGRLRRVRATDLMAALGLTPLDQSAA